MTARTTIHRTNRRAAAALLLLTIAGAAFAVLPARAQVASMFTDPKARNVGDIITIVLVERTSAQRESDWQNDSNAGIKAGADVSSSSDKVSGKFAVDASFNKDARQRNQSLQKDLLSGTMTARVVEVDDGGNMVIEGERKLSVNGESHLLKVTGMVRPYDVRHDNTVLSYQIANADIEYRRGGFHRRFFKPGKFVRVAVLGVIAAAVAFGASN